MDESELEDYAMPLDLKAEDVKCSIMLIEDLGSATWHQFGSPVPYELAVRAVVALAELHVEFWEHPSVVRMLSLLRLSSPTPLSTLHT